MKPKLELVNEKHFSTEEVAAHDLHLTHLGNLRLGTEVTDDGDIILLYFLKEDKKKDGTELGGVADMVAKAMGIEMPSKPMIARIAHLNKFEKFIGVPIAWKVRRTLQGMKKYLIDCDRRKGVAKVLAKQLVGK